MFGRFTSSSLSSLCTCGQSHETVSLSRRGLLTGAGAVLAAGIAGVPNFVADAVAQRPLHIASTCIITSHRRPGSMR